MVTRIKSYTELKETKGIVFFKPIYAEKDSFYPSETYWAGFPLKDETERKSSLQTAFGVIANRAYHSYTSEEIKKVKEDFLMDENPRINRWTNETPEKKDIPKGLVFLVVQTPFSSKEDMARDFAVRIESIANELLSEGEKNELYRG